MSKTRYKFNKESLQIEEVHLTFKDKFKKFLSIISSGLVFAAVAFYISYNFIDSPKERMQQHEIKQYKMQYEVLNDRLDQISKILKNLQNKDDNIYRVIFEAEPIPASIRKAGFGGVDRYAKLDGYKCSKLLINTTKKIDKITSELYVQSKSFDDIFKMAKNKEKMMTCIPAIQPISNKDLGRISSFFGWRIHPIFKKRMFHYGLDFTAPIGTKVYATGDGVVTMAKRSRYGYGNKIIIDHGYGFKTGYAHLHKFLVKKGQKVKRGQVIGTVGNTGLSTGPHLHYEVIKNGVKVNPIYYFFNDLSPQEFASILNYSHRAVSSR